MSDQYYSNPRPDVTSRVPETARRVLDIGCAVGLVGETLLMRGVEEVVGLEFDSRAVIEASRRLSAVHRMDLEDLDSLRSFIAENSGSFDCVIMADVLEHLRDPWSTLAAVTPALRSGGAAVISLPNVRVLSVVLPLVVHGRFDYRDRGVLDRTHLRFFTRRTAAQLIEGAGLNIVETARAPTPWRSAMMSAVGRALGDLGNEQFVFVALKRA